ncbi:DUF4136 domain-containing protein [Bathymodiolus japonicus methanotrophic gill symbiont]|uniref:DUF4136 domain-containing protein n=1 Tax=Bathymodiolus japonicus methanotrophic gill symbiont TaxID=113269 RepID=UPI001C8EDD08|nr:DUF4136 domain-containing protein [Bathymodiolus japonicus methanotrophic gill symbiont]
MPFSLLILLQCCVPYTRDIEVKTEVGTQADLSDYNTYTWLETMSTLNDPSGKWQPTGLDLAGEIKFFIDRELQDHGLHLNTTDPELGVAFQFGADMQSLKLQQNPKSKLAVLSNVPDATLAVILIDTVTKDIIWISKAEAEIQQGYDAELVRKRIDYTITKMFKALGKKSFFSGFWG